MINVCSIQYDLAVITSSGDTLHINAFLRGLQWEEPAEELAARLTAEIQNQQTSHGWLHQLLPLASRLILRANWGEGWKEVWRGTVFDRDYTTDPLGHFTIIAYDMLHYLKSEDNRFWKSGIKARTIITDLAKGWSIPLGQIEGPDVTLGKQMLKGQIISAFILDVLQQSKERGAGKYAVRSTAGKMDIIKVGGNQLVYHFGSDDSIKVVNDREAMDELVTRVKIIGSENQGTRAPVYAQVDGETSFGILQKIMTKQSNETPAMAKQAAQEVLKEQGKPKRTSRVEVPDLPFLRKNDKVHLTAGTLNGYYIITGLHHNPSTMNMIMEVENI